MPILKFRRKGTEAQKTHSVKHYHRFSYISIFIRKIKGIYNASLITFIYFYKYVHWIIHYFYSGKKCNIIIIFMFEVFISIFVICQEYCFNRVFIINFRYIELKLINITLTPNISFYDMGQFFKSRSFGSAVSIRMQFYSLKNSLPLYKQSALYFCLLAEHLYLQIF